MGRNPIPLVFPSKPLHPPKKQTQQQPFAQPQDQPSKTAPRRPRQKRRACARRRAGPGCRRLSLWLGHAALAVVSGVDSCISLVWLVSSSAFLGAQVSVPGEG